MDASFVDNARFRLGRRRTGAALLRAGGAELRVWDRGSGAHTFVLVPDPPNVLEHHERVLDALAAHGRAIGIELPGFGFSRPPPRFRYSLGDNADVLVAAFDALGVERAHLLFPCLSGLLALRLAGRAPSRVAGVVLAQTPSLEDALAWADRVDFKGLVGTPIVGQLLVRASRRRLARGWFRAALPRDAAIEPYLSQTLDAYARGADYALASALQALRRERPELGAVAPPVLAVWGDADRTHRRSDPARALAAARDGRLVVFEGAGHFPDLEQPDRYVAEVLRFAREGPA